MAEVIYSHVGNTVRVRIVSVDNPYRGLLADDAIPRITQELRRVVRNSAARLLRTVRSGYPYLLDTVSQSTAVGGFDFRAGLEISGGFFPLVEYDTRPHWVPWGMPTKKHPEREWSRLATWLQTKRGWALPYASAYPVARAIAAGRASHADGRYARRAGGVAGTFGRYYLTDKFTEEIARLEDEFIAIISRALETS